MSKATLENLISHLHEQFGDKALSPQQQQLMDEMQRHLHNTDEAANPDPSFRDSVELLIEEIEEQHPTAAGIAREILSVLDNIGV